MVDASDWSGLSGMKSGSRRAIARRLLGGDPLRG